MVTRKFGPRKFGPGKFGPENSVPEIISKLHMERLIKQMKKRKELKIKVILVKRIKKSIYNKAKNIFRMLHFIRHITQIIRKIGSQKIRSQKIRSQKNID